LPEALSSEVDTGSHEENALNEIQNFASGFKREAKL
jgi:hypothetical protein